MKRIFVLLFPILFCVHNTIAQKTRYFNFGPGAAYTIFQDDGMSTLPYEGISGYLNLDIETSNDKYWDDFAIRGQFGELQPVNKNGSAMHYYLEMDYRYLFKTKWVKEYNLHLGPGLTVFANQLVHNNYSNNIVHPIWDITLGLVARANRNFHLFKRRFDGALMVDIPLWGAGMRPDYAYGFPSGFYKHPENTWKAIKDSYFFVYPPTLVRFRSRASLTYYIKNKNAIGLVYDWTYSQLNAGPTVNFNNVRAATHGLYFITKFKF